MLITRVIGEAADEHQVHFLVNAYLEAVRYCDPLGLMPGAVRELPFRGIEDAAARVRTIGFMLETQELANDQARVVAKEALGILTAARQRLEALRAESGSLMAVSRSTPSRSTALPVS
jgi:hypothetical protein